METFFTSIENHGLTATLIVVVILLIIEKIKDKDE